MGLMCLKEFMLIKLMACMSILCYHWYFLKVNFRFQPKVCDGYYYLMHKAMSFNDVVIVSVKGNDYRIHF